MGFYVQHCTSPQSSQQRFLCKYDSAMLLKLACLYSQPAGRETCPAPGLELNACSTGMIFFSLKIPVWSRKTFFDRNVVKTSILLWNILTEATRLLSWIEFIFWGVPNWAYPRYSSLCLMYKTHWAAEILKKENSHSFTYTIFFSWHWAMWGDT